MLGEFEEEEEQGNSLQGVKMDGVTLLTLLKDTSQVGQLNQLEKVLV